MSLINVTSLSYSPSLFLCEEKTNLLTFSRGPLENPKLVWGQKKYLEFDLRKYVKNMKDFEHLMKRNYYETVPIYPFNQSNNKRFQRQI